MSTTGRKQKLVVLGSLNMDFVVRAARIPSPGETLFGNDFRMIPGGKGANQAVAAGKLARPGMVAMVGRVGYDTFADHLRASLAAAGVDVTSVHSIRSAASGVALITVATSGENAIVVAPGANEYVDLAQAETLRPLYREAACALFQLETPLDVVARALTIAKEEGAVTILDPAPAQLLPEAMLKNVDYITPNESEAEMLRGIESAARNVIYKLGAKGCRLRNLEIPAFPVETVDTTAAGDVFNAAFAVRLSEGADEEESLHFACASGALAVTRLGAQTSAPSRVEVEALLATAPSSRRSRPY